MGSTQSTEPYKVPTRPFDKHGRHRFSLGTAAGALVDLRKQRSTKRAWRSTTTTTTLAKLVLLQDWQRVLIRVTLFPKEVAKPCIVKLYGVRWKVLPIHLACTLNPPPKVVSLLCVKSTASVPVTKHHRRRQRAIRQWQLRSSRFFTEGKVELLSTREGGSQFSMGDSFSFDSSLITEPKHDHLKRQSAFFNRDSGSVVSLEQSIGDSTHTISEGDEEDTTYATEASSNHLWEKTNVVLQLTESGEIVPMSLVVQPQETCIDATEENEEMASASRTHEPCAEFPNEAFLLAIGQTKTLLSIHIACLYRASPEVLHVLLKADPMGALSSVMGMLPIHILTSGWTVNPLMAPPSQLVSTLALVQESETEHSMLESLKVLIEVSPESATARSACHGLAPIEYVMSNMNEPNQERCVALLTQTTKLCSHSGSQTTENSLSSSDIDDSLDAASSEICCTSSDSTGTDSSQLMARILEGNWTEAMDLTESDLSLAREWHYGIEKNKRAPQDDTSSNNQGKGVPSYPDRHPVLWKRLPLHIACVRMAPIGLIDALIQAYPKGLECSDPHSGFIPLHLACQIFEEPDKSSHRTLIERLLKARPATTKAVDALGRLPIHWAILSQASYGIIELLIRTDPISVLCPDRTGKTPFRYAQKVYPTGDSVLGLLELVWM